jgi:hypothetical protein
MEWKTKNRNRKGNRNRDREKRPEENRWTKGEKKSQ